MYCTRAGEPVVLPLVSCYLTLLSPMAMTSIGNVTSDILMISDPTQGLRSITLYIGVGTVCSSAGDKELSAQDDAI